MPVKNPNLGKEKKEKKIHDDRQNIALCKFLNWYFGKPVFRKKVNTTRFSTLRMRPPGLRIHQNAPNIIARKKEERDRSETEVDEIG